MRLAAAAAPALLALIAAPAAAQLTATVSAASYPADVAPGPAPLHVQLRYELAPDGSVARCEVTRSSRRPSIDSESCRIMRERARFRPERGAMRGTIQFDWLGAPSLAMGNPAGAPIALGRGLFVSMADYPREALARREGGTVRFALQISRTGVPARCEVTGSSGSEALDQRTCELAMARLVFIPASDGAGGRAAGIARSQVRWMLP